MSANHNHAMFIIVSGCECTLLPLPPHSHQTNHAQFSVMWSVEALEGEGEEMGIDSSSAEKQQLAQGNGGKRERVID